MVTSKVIINNLKKEDVSSLLEDLKVLLSTIDGKCHALDVCSILKAAYHLMKGHEDSNKQEKVISSVVPSIHFCVNYIKEKNISDESLKQQFLQILYHIINVYLKLELYADSLSSASNLKTLLINEKSPADDKENYTKFLSALFWNEALKLEKKNESMNFETSFKLRCQAIEFTLFDNNLSTVKNYSYLTLVRYCYNNNQRDSNKIISFLQNVWMHISAEKKSYHDMLYLFKLLYSWFEVAVNYSTDTSVITFVLSLISEMSLNVEGIKITNDEIDVLKSCIDISKYTIRIFSLTQDVSISTRDVLNYGKLFKDNSSDLIVHTCAFFYLSFIKRLNSSESEKIVSLIKPNLAFCTTLVLQYLHIFPGLKLQKGLPFSVNSDITLTGALVKVISLLIKNEDVGEKQKSLIKEAEAFIRVSLEKFKTDSRNIEFENKFSNFAKAIGNIGFTSYNSGFYSESIYFLETGLKYALFDEKDSDKSFMWRQILVYCYFLSGNHKIGLQNVAILLLDYKDKTKECVELWHKVKRDALRNKDMTITSSTISDILEEMNLHINREEEISLLLDELRGCKLERCPSEEEIVNIVKKLMSLQCCGNNWAYVMLVTITMGLSCSKKIFSLLNKSSLNMCVETTNVFKEYIIENPTNNEVKIQLSISYVWLFFLKLQQLHKQAEKKEAAFFEPKSEEEESESDIMPTIPLLTFLVEAETIKNLEMALELWTDISKNSWGELAEPVKNWDLLTVIQAAAELFSISANDVHELRTLVLLQTVASAVGNKEQELNSSIALINFLVRIGYLEMASRLLKVTDISVFNGEESSVMRLKLQLAESNFLLQKGRFDEGLKLLRSVLIDPIFEKSYKSIKMLQIQSLMLQSKFLLVPPSAFTDSENVEYLSMHNAISSAMDCASAAKRLLKLLTEKQTVEGYNDWIVLRTQLLKSILNAYLLLAEHYMQIGDPRFARCFLLEGLKFAEEHILTYWSSKMLILLGQVDLMCKDINDCMVKLNCLKYVMDENSKENASMLLHNTFNNTEMSESVDVSEDFIISNETRLNFKRAIKQNFINNSDVQSSPISNKRETNSKFQVKSDACSDHSMFSVYLIKLEIWALSCLHLIAEGKTLLAETQLKKLLKKCELMKSTNKKVCSVLKTFNVDLKKDALIRVPSLSERMLSVSILHRLSLLNYIKGDFKLTNSYLDSAFKALSESSEWDKYLYSNTYGLLKYHQTVVSVKSLIGIKPDSCLEFAVCPSVEVKSLATKKVLKDSPILNVTPQKVNIPKIHISPCAKKRICKAPIKKDVLPAHIKKDINELSKSNAFSSLIFSSSDDELFFISPMPSAPKKSNIKTNSTTLYKEGHENEKNSYKLFKSKNSDLSINASCDIWKFPDLATPKVNKLSKLRSNQLATKSLRKTKQNTRIAKSDTNCTSKLLDPTNVKQSTKPCSNKRSVLCSGQDSLVESNKSSLYGYGERRVSIEHYRGTSKRMQKQNNLEDIAMEEDVFYPDCTGDVLNTKKQPDTFDFPLEGKHPSFMETLCDDLNALDITENVIGMMEHKIPDEKLIEFINELDEIRLLVQHNAPYPLYVNLCKLLAVLIMHKNVNISKPHDSAFLLSETFASILRQIYLGNYLLFKENTDNNNANSPRELSKLLKRKDTCIIKQMECLLNAIPADFTVVQITPLFEKENETSVSKCNVSKLIICRYQKNSQSLVMCLNSCSSEMSTTSIFADFANILSESTLIMKNNDDRRSWWTTRSTLDMRLKSLVKCIEDTWVGCWKGLLLSSSTNEKRVKHLRKIRDSICKLSEPANKCLLEVLLDSASFLSRGQLSAAVCHLWNCKPSDDIFSQVYKSIHEATAELPETKRNPLILILDKDIQALPWESLPILNAVPVSRMPSLNILISKLSMPDNKSALREGLDCTNAYYILNPGGDLKYSQEYFQPRFEKQTNWEGIVGKPPSAKECALALKNRDLFVYCGHGSGKQYLEGKTIDKMRCHASAILMGCSSGRLKQFGKQLEAYGMPLTYLMNGCPCIVGNLWDVTDKDIDRFTDKLFELFVPNYKEDQDTTDVATAVSDARSACKMRYLVGSAPIIYGFPVFAKK